VEHVDYHPFVQKLKITKQILTIFNSVMIEAYFRITLFSLRFGGISIQLQSVSTINRIHCEMMRLCSYIIFVAFIMDFVLKNLDIHESMKNIRIIFGLAVFAWMHLYLR